MKLNLSGYVTPNTSYGLVLLNILNELTKQGVECSLFPAGVRDNDCGIFNEVVQTAITNSIIFDDTAPSLRIAHQFDLATRIGRGPSYGYTFFEMNHLTPFERRHIDSVDKLFVCSDWANQICQKNGVRIPISTVPLGFNPEIFNTVDYHNKEKCVFLSIGKWEVRKGQEEIVEAFSQAFANVDNVELWMSFDNRFLSEDFILAKKDFYSRTLGHKVRFIPRLKSQMELARAMHQTYCFVAPSRAEGFNLELLEAMACGLHTIATNYSGHTQFLDASTHKIQPTKMIKAVDNKWFNMNPNINIGEWIDYNIQDLVDAMQKVYEEYTTNPSKLNLQAHVSNFTWEKCASKLKEEIFNG